MVWSITELRKIFERKVGQRNHIHSELTNAISEIIAYEKEIITSEKAQSIIMAVARATQSELEYRIAEPVSLALAAVYNNPYQMRAQFEITGRGTTECHLNFERNGMQIKPLEASGGGPVDVASFALRIGSWSLSQPRTRPILILDEPFKWISRDKMILAGQMLQEAARQLGLQIIMISHIPELIECADIVLNVGINGGKSELIIE